MKKILTLSLVLCVAFVSGCAADSTVPETPEKPAPITEEEPYADSGLDAGAVGLDDVIEVLTRPRPAGTQEPGRQLGFGDDSVAQLRYDVRRDFESWALPRLMIELRGIITYEIAGAITEVTEARIRNSWDGVALITILGELSQLDGFTVDATIGAMMLENSDEVLNALDLTADRHILSVELEQLSEGVSTVIIEMYYTGWGLLSSRIAIVYLEGFGLGYYLHQRSLGEYEGETIYVLRFVVEVIEDIGPLPYLRWEEAQLPANTREAFVNGILLNIEAMLA